MNKSSLVTGGAGFIGAHTARELLRMGHKVIILDDLSGGFEENLPGEALFIKGSNSVHRINSQLEMRGGGGEERRCLVVSGS